MSRLLWLRVMVDESSPAVMYPAMIDDVILLDEFLTGDAEERTTVRQQLDSQLAWSRKHSRHVCCQRSNGLHVVLPLTLARWLTLALQQSDRNRAAIHGRLTAWLQTAARSKHRVAQPAHQD